MTLQHQFTRYDTSHISDTENDNIFKAISNASTLFIMTEILQVTGALINQFFGKISLPVGLQ